MSSHPPQGGVERSVSELSIALSQNCDTQVQSPPPIAAYLPPPIPVLVIVEDSAMTLAADTAGTGADDAAGQLRAPRAQPSARATLTSSVLKGTPEAHDTASSDPPPRSSNAMGMPRPSPTASTAVVKPVDGGGGGGLGDSTEDGVCEGDIVIEGVVAAEMLLPADAVEVAEGVGVATGETVCVCVTPDVGVPVLDAGGPDKVAVPDDVNDAEEELVEVLVLLCDGVAEAEPEAVEEAEEDIDIDMDIDIEIVIVIELETVVDKLCPMALRTRRGDGKLEDAGAPTKDLKNDQTACSHPVGCRVEKRRVYANKDNGSDGKKM